MYAAHTPADCGQAKKMDEGYYPAWWCSGQHCSLTETSVLGLTFQCGHCMLSLCPRGLWVP